MKKNNLKESTYILIHGHLGRGNVGDEAMLQVIVNLLKQRIPASEFFIVYGSDTAQHIKIEDEAYYIPRTFRHIISSLCASDFFVLAGGTHLTFFGKNKIGKWMGILRQSATVIAARLLGVKVLMLSVGLGPFDSFIARWMVRFTLSQVHFISVRDEASEKELPMLKYKGFYSRCSDAAFFLKHRTVQAKKEVKRLGISILPYFAMHMRNPDKDVFLVKAFSSVIRTWMEIFPEGEVFVFPICSQQGPYSDTIISERLAHVFTADKRVGKVTLKGDPDALINLMHSLSHFIGMRYHSILFACLSSLPTINIAYHQKNWLLSKELIMQNRSLISVNEVLSGDLERRIPSFCHNPSQFLAGKQSPDFTMDRILPESVIKKI
ncbi:MAG: polysaccharide pyruvyl transferase family protein [Desulfobacteraceae bacterium]|nr:polysaccharide pyruvyl transferase family protein [Desulfobacteraceae bacterium]